MKRLEIILGALLVAAVLCCASPLLAAKKAPPLKEMGSQEVTTEYFSLTIPKGWSMPVAPRKMPNSGMTVVFGRMSQDLAVSMNVMKTPMTAREIGESTIANMKKGGMNVGPLEEKNGLWETTLSKGNGKGKAWFGAADGVAAVTIVTGNDVEKANEIFSAIQPKIKGIFPTAAN